MWNMNNALLTLWRGFTACCTVTGIWVLVPMYGTMYYWQKSVDSAGIGGEAVTGLLCRSEWTDLLTLLPFTWLCWHVTEIKEHVCQISLQPYIDSSAIFTFSNTDLSATESFPDMQVWDKNAHSESNLTVWILTWTHMKADKQQLCRSCVLCLCAGQLIYILLTHQKTIKLTMLYLAHVENHTQKLVVRVFSESYCKQHQNTIRAVRGKRINSVDIHAAPRMKSM